MFDAEAKYIPLEAIIDYLTGSATQQTLDEVSEWCAFSPENETYFVQMKEIWFSIVAERRNDFDQQLAFEEFKVSVQRLMGNKPFAPVKASPMRKLLSIAAAVLAVVAVGGFLVFGRSVILETSITLRLSFLSSPHTCERLPKKHLSRVGYRASVHVIAHI